MRIGIDARCLTGPYTGDRSYWEGLINGLLILDADFELVLFSDIEIPAGMVPPSARVQMVVLPTKWSRYFSMVQLPIAASRYSCDVVHVQYSVSPLFRMPVVTTIHDISFMLYPECFKAKDRLLLSYSVPSAMHRATQVITVSNSSRDDILKKIPINPNKVHATPLAVPVRLDTPAVRWNEISSEYGGESDYFMLLGVRQPRKNLPLAIQAYAQYRAMGGEARLLIVGKPGWGEDKLSTSMHDCGIRDHVQFTGYVPDDHLKSIYTHAKALLYPSIYEGFGLPPLEAMSLGCFVMASDIPVMHEVCGDAAVFLPTDDPKPWADAMHQLNPQSAEQQIKRGQLRSHEFNWAETARKTMKIYKLAQLTQQSS